MGKKNVIFMTIFVSVPTLRFEMHMMREAYQKDLPLGGATGASIPPRQLPMQPYASFLCHANCRHLHHSLVEEG